MPVLAIDLTLFIGLATALTYWNQRWLICSAVLQALTVLAHFGKMLNPHLLPYGYQVMATWSSFPALLLLGASILRRRRASRVAGPHWRTFSREAPAKLRR